MAMVAEQDHVQPEGWWSKDAVAVVTGSNKGLGHEIVLKLAREGVTVVSTARGAHRVLEAVESAVKAEPQLAELIRFHQLDITNAEHVWRNRYPGDDSITFLTSASFESGERHRRDPHAKINNAALNNDGQFVYEEAVEIVAANYFGTRRVTETLLPLLRASPHGARIVMISAQMSLLECFASNEYVEAKVAEAVDHRDICTVDALAARYLEDVKGGRAEEENWTFPHHYKESKLFLNTYTRILAEELLAKRGNEKVLVNAMCPGIFTSDMWKGITAGSDPAVVEQITAKFGLMTATEAAAAPVWLALLPKEDYPYGQFFINHKLKSTF